MPLTACISLTSDGDGRSEGDVQWLRRSADDPPAWPPAYRRRFLIIHDWQDAAIEAELEARAAAGEERPCVTWPYAAEEEVTLGDVTHREVKQRSLLRVEIDELADAAAVRNPQLDVAPKRKSSLTFARVELGERQIARHLPPEMTAPPQPVKTGR